VPETTTAIEAIFFIIFSSHLDGSTKRRSEKKAPPIVFDSRKRKANPVQWKISPRIERMNWIMKRIKRKMHLFKCRTA
jgi:hypothetical protein